MAMSSALRKTAVTKQKHLDVAEVKALALLLVSGRFGLEDQDASIKVTTFIGADYPKRRAKDLDVFGPQLSRPFDGSIRYDGT